MRVATLQTAADLGAPASAAALAAYLGDKSKPRSERALAARALGAVVAGGATDGTKALAAALLDGDAAVRVGALAGILKAGEGGYRSRGMFYKVQPLFKDRDAQVRGSAVLAAAALERLAREGGARVLPRFLALLLETAAPGERVRYAEAWLRATSS